MCHKKGNDVVSKNSKQNSLRNFSVPIIDFICSSSSIGILSGERV